MVNDSKSSPGLRLRLFYTDKVLHEINAGSITGEIEIGRSSACAWAVPATDTLISSHHAVLVRDGRDITLRDKGSKNGTWFEGKRITEKKIKVGDHFTLGHCVLKVEMESAEAVAKHLVELEVLNGNQRGEVKAITADRLIIGTSPEADLLLTDELVSRQHATIIRRNEDSYWLKALATTNGTKVNDVPLRADQERLLKNGDRIALAHVELLFRDGSTHHDHGQALRRLGVMAAAVAVFMSLYFGWQLIRSSAASTVNQAQALKEAGQFSRARELLDGAVNRRGYRNVQMNADLLRAQVTKCETTSMQWSNVQQQLEKKDWAAAAAQLGSLQSLYNDNDAWGWREGSTLREHARQVKTWLDAYLNAGHPENFSGAALADGTQQLATAIKQMQSQKNYDALVAAANERLKNLQQYAASYASLNAALQKISQSTLPSATVLKSALAEMENCRTNPAASVRQKAETMLPLARQLAASHQQLEQAIRLTRDLQFKEAASLKPGLPAPEDCMVEARLFDFRRNLENSWNNFKSELTVVSRLVGALSSRISSPESEPPDLVYWRDQSALEKVLQCDSLTRPYPKRTRAEPSGEYDRAVGIEFLYGWLRAVGTQSSSSQQEPQFETKLMAARQTIEAARVMVNFFPTASDKPYLQDGQLKQWAEAARKTLSLREAIVGELSQRSQSVTGRESLIAGGIALRLMDEPDAALAKKLAGQMAALRSAVFALNNKKDSANLVEQRIEISKAILQTGLPGDPVVNQIWQASNNSDKSE